VAGKVIPVPVKIDAAQSLGGRMRRYSSPPAASSVDLYCALRSGTERRPEASATVLCLENAFGVQHKADLPHRRVFGEQALQFFDIFE
jgi:hypothetical protein